MPIRVLLAEDHLIVRQVLKAVLEREGFEVLGEASDGYQAIELARSLHPDVVILDFDMPLLNGIDAGQEIVKSCPGTRTILLTMYADEQYVQGAVKAGIRGFVVKTQAAQDLINAIKDVHRGEVYLSTGISKGLLDAYLGKKELPSGVLTTRERQVLQLIAEGKTTKEVAKRLEISVKTAESHRTKLMKKLDIHETASLVRYAIREGLIQP